MADQTSKKADEVPDNKEDKEEEEAGIAAVGDLFMLAESKEYLFLLCGLFFALVNGLGDPLMIVLFSESLSALSDPDDTLKVMGELAILFVILGAVLQVAASFQYYCFTRVAKTLSLRMQKKWLRALLRQDPGWFDRKENDPGALPGKMSSSMVSFEEGVGCKLGLGLQFFSGFIAGLVIAFVFNPYVSLITIAAMPLVAGAGAFLVKVNTEAAEVTEKAYARANALAYETFKGLKTVLSVNGSSLMEEKFKAATEDAKKAGIKRSLKVGFANGSMLSTFNIMYLAITLFGGWALSYQIERNGCDPSGSMSPRYKCTSFSLPMEMDGTGIFIALMSIAIGGQALGQVATSIDAFTLARKAMKPAVDVMRRTPTIDANSNQGLILNKSSSQEGEGEEKSKKRREEKTLEGSLVFEDVHFCYPTRPDVQVLRGFNLEVQGGETIALVGESGCGKSTITQLLQRFYDPMQGTVKLDGVALTDLNVRWLREQVAVVAQEPRLFSGTIAENIAYGSTRHHKGREGKEGREGDKFDAPAAVLHEEIVEAAKLANAHGFITELHDGYDTQVGFGGSQLSGGQKQRVAIARALLKQPKILLLDEATSALDNKSEKAVQEALDNVLGGAGAGAGGNGKGKGRTTVVIAHRLSTIRTADVIGYVKEGKVVEKGTHEELMQIEGGLYRELVEKQDIQGSVNTLNASSKNNSSADLHATEVVAGQSNEANGRENENESVSERVKDHTLVDVPLGSPASTSAPGSTLVSVGGGKGVLKKDTEKEEDFKVPWSRILSFNRPDAKYLLFGVLSSVVAGSLFPFWGFMFAKMTNVFFTPVLPCVDTNGSLASGFPSPSELGYASCKDYFKKQADDMWDEAVFLSVFWVLVAVLCLLSNAGMFLGFGTASERLCFRVRNRMFTCYLRQEPGYFDLPENAVGSVCARLSSDATLLKAKTGEPLQQVMITVFGCLGGVVLAAVFAWPIALMAVGVLPILATAMSIQASIMMGQSIDAGQATFKDEEDGKDTKDAKDAKDGKASGTKASSPRDSAQEVGALAGESLTAMRTVASFGLEGNVARRYDDLLDKCKSGVATSTSPADGKKKGKEGFDQKHLVKKSLGFGLSFSLQHWAWSLLLWFGAWVLDNSDFGFEDFSIAIFAFFFGLFGMSMAATGATDTKQAVKALTNIFSLLDRATSIDPQSNAGVSGKGGGDGESGELGFTHVAFTYPSRPDSKNVVDDLSFTILPGEKIGVVGSSGSGKSTIIQLLERFYDPVKGQVLFDKVDIQNLNYQWMHSQIGMVGQEPVLFKGTVAENISFGAAGGASMEEIADAARLANADGFIRDLPLGYDTDVGPGGALLSGGQKQRVAIARAIICKPKVLLLDEATSALDSTSEAVVQEALDKLMQESNLTTVMIAHRLSTVRHMTKILVIEKGQVIEVGTHDDLMSKEGVYYSLVQASAH